MNFNQPHLVPQTASGNAMYKGDQQSRNNQISAYKKDRSNNKRQMDDIHQAQYRKQNTAVKDQKRHMQNNAAKSSRLVTGSSAYNKEEFTLRDFMDLCEGKQKRLRKLRKANKEQNKLAKNRKKIDSALDAVRGKEDDDPRTMPEAPKKKKNLAAFRAQQPEEKKKEGVKEPQSQVKKGSRIPKVGTVHQRMSVSPKKETASKATQKTNATKDDERAQRMKHREEKQDAWRAKQKKQSDQEKMDRKHQGVRAGIKQQLGGDLISRDKKVRGKARKELVQKTAKGARELPGKALKQVGRAGRAGLEGMKASRQYEVGTAGENNSGVASVDKAND